MVASQMKWAMRLALNIFGSLGTIGNSNLFLSFLNKASTQTQRERERERDLKWWIESIHSRVWYVFESIVSFSLFESGNIFQERLLLMHVCRQKKTHSRTRTHRSERLKWKPLLWLMSMWLYWITPLFNPFTSS